ncbi:hypothetical protein FRC08_018545 [Ceratobasidium sp. 394]|nr:hypothetical protein FRC08_018545 [Ceratobasidium sp. 394]
MVACAADLPCITTVIGRERRTAAGFDLGPAWGAFECGLGSATGLPSIMVVIWAGAGDELQRMVAAATSSGS